jgi:hypothetical protein
VETAPMSFSDPSKKQFNECINFSFTLHKLRKINKRAVLAIHAIAPNVSRVIGICTINLGLYCQSLSKGQTEVLCLKLQNCVDRKARVKLELGVYKKAMRRQFSFLFKGNKLGNENKELVSPILKSKPNSKQTSIIDDSPSNNARVTSEQRNRSRVRDSSRLNMNEKRNSTMRIKLEGKEGYREGAYTERLMNCLREQIRINQEPKIIEDNLRREIDHLREDVIS